MAGFSATDAAFTGFRIVWERPVSVVYWAAVQFVASLGSALIITLSAGPLYMQAFHPKAPATNALQFAGQLQALAPTWIELLIPALVLNAVFSAAMNRAVLHPEQSSFGYLRLASDELRQLGLTLLIAVLLAMLNIGVITVVTFVFVLLGYTGDAGVGLSMVILLPLIAVLYTVVGVRFSLASPLTYDTRRIDLMGSWRLTRGRFWPLLWTYLMAFVLSLVVTALAYAIAVFSAAIVGGGFAALSQDMEDMTSLATALAPERLLTMAILAVGSALSLPVTMTPAATVYRMLTGGGASAVGKTSD